MAQLVSLLTLAGVFTLATLLPINMGILAFVVGAISGVSIEDVTGFFPGDTFLLVVGITLLFGVAKVNGTIDLVVAASLKLVLGRRWAVVWLMFALTAVLMSLGSVLAVGMLAPIAMPIAARYRINPLLMGMMLSHGALSAAFSPITVYGAFTIGMVKQAGLDVSPLLLFAVPFGLNVLFAAALFALLGRDLLHRGNDVSGPTGAAPENTGGSGSSGATTSTLTHTTQRTAVMTEVQATPLRVITLSGMLVLLIAGAFGVDAGLASLISPQR